MVATGIDTKKRLYILLLLFFGLILFGCVEKSIYPSESEILAKETSFDLDDDGVPDQYIYTFEPKIIGNVSVQREMIVQRLVGNLVVMRLTLQYTAAGRFTDITMREIIPSALAVRVGAVNFTTIYSEVARTEPPITVVWKYTFGGGENITKPIEYSVIAYQEITRSWVERNIRSPDIEVGTLDPRTATFVVSLRNLNDSYVKFLRSILDFYIAIAAYSASLFCAFIIVLEVLSVFAAFILAMVKRVRFSEEIFNWVGKGRKDNKTWTAIGIVLILVGISIIALTEEFPGSVEMSTFVRIGSNMHKSTGSIAILIGVVSLFYVILDLVKGSILGKRYFLEPVDVAQGHLRTLIGRIKELRSRIREYAGMGIETSTEEIVGGVEQRRAERISQEMDEENVDLYMPLIIKSISDIEATIEGLSTKMGIFKRWPEWRASIDEMLTSRERVSPEELLDIPERWRRWALTKYLSEHLGEALTIEDGALTKMKIAAIGKADIAAVLADLMRAGRIEGTAIVRKDGLVVAARLPKGVDQNLIAAIAAKVVANAEMVSGELEKGNTQFIILRSSGGETVIYEGAKVSLIALVKPGESTGYVISEMEKVMNKLNKMF